MKRLAAFTLTLWSAAALLYFDARSIAGIALCGVLVLAALDLCAPSANGTHHRRAVRDDTGADRL